MLKEHRFGGNVTTSAMKYQKDNEPQIAYSVAPYTTLNYERKLSWMHFRGSIQHTVPVLSIKLLPISNWNQFW